MFERTPCKCKCACAVIIRGKELCACVCDRPKSGQCGSWVWLKKRFHHLRGFDGNKQGQKVSS